MHEANVPVYVLKAVLQRNEDYDRPDQDWRRDIGRATVAGPSSTPRSYKLIEQPSAANSEMLDSNQSEGLHGAWSIS